MPQTLADVSDVRIRVLSQPIVVSFQLTHKGIYVVDIVFRGKAYQNQRLGVIMKGLSTNNIIITNIFKDVRVPHGGCRGKKQRRV